MQKTKLIIRNPLSLDGWLEFNAYKWGVKPSRLRVPEEGKELPSAEVVLYTDSRGRIVQPPLNPYLPLVFHPTATVKTSRIYRQWTKISELLVEQFIERGLKGSVAFPPEVMDVRQWQWNSFLAEVRYTFYIRLPYNLELADLSQRSKARKAKKEGFSCEVAGSEAFRGVVECMQDTGNRQGFNYRLTHEDLRNALTFLGEEVFHVYVCRSPSGEVASARVALGAPGMIAMDWIAGTKREFLKSGVTQLLIAYELDHLSRLRIEVFDFVGANLPTVSLAKAGWGGELVPYYVVRPINLRSLAALAARAVQFRWGKR